MRVSTTEGRFETMFGHGCGNFRYFEECSKMVLGWKCIRCRAVFEFKVCDIKRLGSGDWFRDYLSTLEGRRILTNFMNRVFIIDGEKLL